MDAQPVLVVVEVKAVHDAQQMNAYQAAARLQLAKYGGEVVARGGSSCEGDPPFGPLLLQRWPSAQAFRDWQESEEYRPLRELRQRSADIRIAIVPMSAPVPVVAAA
jgi:uncharacterized protein (DUF1330 family)